jgi:hypothetical protein
MDQKGRFELDEGAEGERATRLKRGLAEKAGSR